MSGAMVDFIKNDEHAMLIKQLPEGLIEVDPILWTT
tara:strand:+ start:86 stop:193 length:108 start_codon:yes stop_codon:yes gene_type:complete